MAKLYLCSPFQSLSHSLQNFLTTDRTVFPFNISHIFPLCPFNFPHNFAHFLLLISDIASKFFLFLLCLIFLLIWISNFSHLRNNFIFLCCSTFTKNCRNAQLEKDKSHTPYLFIPIKIHKTVPQLNQDDLWWCLWDEPSSSSHIHTKTTISANRFSCHVMSWTGVDVMDWLKLFGF